MPGVDRLECRAGDEELNLQLVQAAVSGCCCDRHGSAAALLLIRVGIELGMKERGLALSQEADVRDRDRFSHLFQKDHANSDRTAAALLELLIQVLAFGRSPDDRSVLPRVEVG